MYKKLPILLLLFLLTVQISPSWADINKDLNDAVRERDLKQTASLIAKGANVNKKSEDDGITPLHNAALYGHEKIAQFLIDHGADIHSRATVGDPVRSIYSPAESMTPLHVAADRGFYKIVKLLLDHGALVNARNYINKTPLHFAALDFYSIDKPKSNISKLKCAQILLSYGALVNARNAYGWTPLHYTAERGGTKMIDLLLAKGAYVNALDIDSDSPLDVILLHTGFSFNGENVAKMFNSLYLLIERGADFLRSYLYNPNFHFAGNINQTKSSVIPIDPYIFDNNYYQNRFMYEKSYNKNKKIKQLNL